MDNTAENMDFMESGNDQLAKLQSLETDTATIIEINELRGNITNQLARAEEEGVISKRDVKKWNNILKDSGNSKQKVADIQHQVLAVIEESKRLIAELPAGEKEVAIFRQMSIREKKEYLTNLRKASDDLKGRADKLGDLFPDAVEKLQTLRGVERAKYLEELNIRRANIVKYDLLLEQNSKHFSKKSRQEYIDMFKELSISKQADWLRKFDEDHANPRVRLTARFEALPPKYRERIGNFSEMARHDKEKVVVKAEEEKAFADKLYGNPDHKYMSSKSRKFMKKTFIEADSHLRRAMMEMLGKVIRDEAELGKKFEALKPDVKNMCSDFMEKNFEEKKDTLEKLMVDDYRKRLQPWLERKIIGESSVTTWIDWFRELDSDKKITEGTDEKMKGQMPERIELKARFEKELSGDAQKANAHFYQLGHHERKELFEKLKQAQEAKNNGADVVSEGVEKKSAMTVKKETSGGIETGMAVNANEKGSDLDESRILEEVKRTKEGSTLMKKRIRDKNIAEGLADLAVNSDLTNQGVYESSHKNKHLQNEKERRLNDELVRFSGGKVVAESGNRKAKKVKEVDLDKIGDGVVTEDELLDLKKEVLNNQGEKARNVFHLQFADRKSGQKLSGAMGKQRIVKQQKELHDHIAEDVASRMVSEGEKMDRVKKEKLRRIIEKDKLKVDLREAA